MRYGFNLSKDGVHYMGGEFRSTTRETAFQRAKELVERFPHHEGWRVCFEVYRDQYKSCEIDRHTVYEDLD